MKRLAKLTALALCTVCLCSGCTSLVAGLVHLYAGTNDFSPNTGTVDASKFSPLPAPANQPQP
jgi:hypothetical protein